MCYKKSRRQLEAEEKLSAVEADYHRWFTRLTRAFNAVCQRRRKEFRLRKLLARLEVERKLAHARSHHKH